jgi:hypothetical protein
MFGILVQNILQCAYFQISQQVTRWATLVIENRSHAGQVNAQSVYKHFPVIIDVKLFCQFSDDVFIPTYRKYLAFKIPSSK